MQPEKVAVHLSHDLRTDPTTRLLESRKDMVFPYLAGGAIVFSANYFHRPALPVI